MKPDLTAGRRECPVCQEAMIPVAWSCCLRCHDKPPPEPLGRARSTSPSASPRAPDNAPQRPARGAAKGKPAPYLSTPAEITEAKLQTAVEVHLEQRGYWRRTPRNIRAGPPPRGWQVHLHQCRENPILLDVLILANDGHYLELELKTATGRATAEQRELLAGRDVCRSVLEARRAVEAWEQQPKRGKDGAHD